VAVTYMGAHVSHAHYNPAITFAHYLSGSVNLTTFWQYSLSQAIGAALAGTAALVQGAASSTPSADAGETPLKILFAEFLFSFALILVHLNILGSTIKTGRLGNDFFGLAVGFTYLAAVSAVGDVSGGILNPAIGVGLFVANGISGVGFAAGPLLYYLVGPAVGAIFANLVYAYQVAGKHALPSMA